MYEYYRVLLPKWIFLDKKQQVNKKAHDYLQRYPGYMLVKIDNGFALCIKS